MVIIGIRQNVEKRNENNGILSDLNMSSLMITIVDKKFRTTPRNTPKVMKDVPKYITDPRIVF